MSGSRQKSQPHDAVDSVFRLLRKGDFRRLWIADGLWWQGMWVEQIAIGWLVLDLTDSAWWVAMIGFARSVPLPFVGLFGPSLSDRFKRRHVILAVQATSLATMALITSLYWLQLLQYWHLAAAALVSGCSWSLEWPARRAMFPDLVGKSKVVDAMVLESMLQSVSKVSGPLLAGSIIQGFGMLGALTLLTALLALSVFTLAGLKTDSRSPDPPRGLRESWHRVRVGFQHVRRRPPILGVLLITAIMNGWSFPYQVLLPVFARDVLSQGPMGLGMLGAAVGLGSLIGLVVVNRIRRRLSNEVIFAVSSAVACVGLVAFSASTSFALSLGFLFLAGTGHAGFSTMQSSITLLRSADEMRTRTMGTVVLAIGVGPLGRLQGGAMAQAWGAPLAVGSMALGAILAMAVVTLVLRGFIIAGRTSQDGSEHAAESSPAR